MISTDLLVSQRYALYDLAHRGSAPRPAIQAATANIIAVPN